MIDFLSNLSYKTYVGLFLCSLFAGYWLTPKASWLARGLGIVASTRRNDTVLSLGGLAVGIPFITGITLLLLLKNQVSENMYMVPLHMRGLFFGSCLAMGLGIVHDILRLNNYLRIFLQTLLAGIAYYYGFRLELFSETTHPPFALGNIALTLLWVCGIINIFDIYNRLRPSFTRFSLLLILSLLCAAFLLDQYRTIVVCCLFSGSLLGVLSHHKALQPNLGSGGTFTIGFALAVTTLQSQLTDHLYGISLFIIVATLFLLFISYKKSAHQPYQSLQENYLQLRSLNHLCQALVIQIEMSEDENEAWDLLCLGAETFGYYGLSQYSSTGERFKTWGQSAQTSNISHPLWRSGGYIHIFAPKDKIATIQALFSPLLETYDRIREKQVLSQLQEEKNNLRIILVNRYYAGTSATGQIIEELAEDLSRSGVAVSVITSSLSYEDSTLIPGKNELLNGIHIYRLPATHFGRSSSLNRIMDFAFFYLFSLSWIAKTPASRYTHIMTFTDPPLIALSGLIAQRLKRWKFIYNVQDLYPDTALALGAMSEGALYRLFYRFNTQLLQQADAIVAISDKMASRIRLQVCSQTRIDIIPNWADAEKIKPAGKSHADLRRELHIDDVFTLVYAGNMGLAQEIDVLIEVIEAFAGSTQIQFIFMGGGVRKIDLERATRKMLNVHFVEYQNKESLSSYLELADIGIVTLAPTMEQLAIPTRTYTYLAAGLPLLVIADEDSELKKFANLGLGAHFTPAMADEIVHFLNVQIKRGRQNRRTEIRSYFIEHFERRLQTDRYWKLLKEV